MIEVEAKISFSAWLNSDKITCHKRCTWDIDPERLRANCLRDNKELDVSDSGKPIAREECQQAAQKVKG